MSLPILWNKEIAGRCFYGAAQHTHSKKQKFLINKAKTGM